MDFETIVRGGLSLFALLYSAIFHELMHALVALKLGDPTGKDEGRITLNPLAHIDPFNTVLLPGMLFMATNGAFVFGGAKPVRINSANFRDPGLGMLLSAGVGPITNFILAIIVALILAAVGKLDPSWLYNPKQDQITVLGFFLTISFILNILLGVFNLLPLPPLDGSRILRYFLPPNGKTTMDMMEPYGLFILVPLMLLGAHGPLISFFFKLGVNLVGAMIGPGLARDLFEGALDL